MDEYYNKHYICIDMDNNIIDGWSDGPFRNKDATGAICINAQGSYPFQLFPNGKENPSLDEKGVYLYRYIDGEIIPKTAEEIAAETPVPEPAMPTLQQQVQALSAAMITIMTRGVANV